MYCSRYLWNTNREGKVMKIETKYNPGDEVWVIAENRIQHLCIQDFAIETSSVVFNDKCEFVSCELRVQYYLGKNEWAEEDMCFPTKEELIKGL